MQSREQRRNVVIRSKIRSGAAWRDASILNLSSRGLGLHAPAPPELGSYVEITRGPHIMVARVVWVRGNRFGVFTQDAIPIDSVISDCESSGLSCSQPVSEMGVERRSTTRSLEHRHETNRALASAMEFVFIGVLGASGAMLAFNLVKQAIGSPVAQVLSALS